MHIQGAIRNLEERLRLLETVVNIGPGLQKMQFALRDIWEIVSRDDKVNVEAEHDRMFEQPSMED